MTWTDGMISAVNPTGGLISSFSSYGLSPDLRSSRTSARPAAA
jgi:minor extracellular serine protease Vpr